MLFWVLRAVFLRYTIVFLFFSGLFQLKIGIFQTFPILAFSWTKNHLPVKISCHFFKNKNKSQKMFYVKKKEKFFIFLIIFFQVLIIRRFQVRIKRKNSNNTTPRSKKSKERVLVELYSKVALPQNQTQNK